ncbi:MAG: hypothetical protein ACRDZQ_01145 [Acidimicrobiales bacterium]
MRIATGTIDAVCAEAARRLVGFIAALVVLLRSLPVLHADETTDRIGTNNCCMHGVSARIGSRMATAAARAAAPTNGSGPGCHDRLR